MTVITTPTQIRFGDLVKAESCKCVNTWATLVLSVFTAAILAVIAIEVVATYPDPTKIATGTDPQFLLLGMTSILTAVIVILPATLEWTQRGVLTTFAVGPRRERVVAVRTLVILRVILTVWLAA